MKRIARIVIALVGLGVCAMGMTMLGSAPAHTQQGPPQFDVNVVNTPTIQIEKLITTSGRAVLSTGNTSQTASLHVPSCSPGTQFIVTGVQVGFETLGGSTDIDVVTLGKWAVQVPTRQKVIFSNGTSVTSSVGLVVMGDGPEHASASIPGGQQAFIPGFPGTLDVRAVLLGGSPAAARYEFLIHVTGGCGTPFVGQL